MGSRMSRFVLAGVALGVAVFAAHRSWGQVAEHPVLLALSKTDHTLSIVDPVTLKVIAKMPVGPDPHEVIASADGTRAWVSNMLNSQGHEMDVLDLVNHKALPSIDTAPMIGLHGLDFQGGKVWFTAQGAKSIGRLDPKTGKTDWIMGTGQDFTHLIRVMPDGQTIFVSNAHSASVSIIENREVPPDPTHPAPPGTARRDWYRDDHSDLAGHGGLRCIARLEGIVDRCGERWQALDHRHNAAEGSCINRCKAERRQSPEVHARRQTRFDLYPFDGRSVCVRRGFAQRGQANEPRQRMRRYPGGSGRLTRVRGLHRSQLRCSGGSENPEGYEPSGCGRRTGRFGVGEATMMSH